MIEVHPYRRTGYRYIYLRYVDPVTGERIERSSRCENMRDARKAAAKLQAELLTGGVAATNVAWNQLRELFLDDLVGSPNYISNVNSTLNVIENNQRPDRATRLTAEWLKRFRKKMETTGGRNGNGRKPATIHKYLQHIHTLLQFAVDEGYLTAMPKFPKEKRNAGKRTKHMKGRPLTTEEYERMISACVSDGLKELLEGLWLSGLRLHESLLLTWDQWVDGIRIHQEGGEMMLLIDGDDQKNGKATLHPLTDDFAEFLQNRPKKSGFVFNPTGVKGVVSRRVDTVSKWIIDVGEKAHVKVDEVDGEPVWGSAHDFRRAFGTRWAHILPAMALKDLMRHASVTTTEKFYIGLDAIRTIETMRQHVAALNPQTRPIQQAIESPDDDQKTEV